MVRVEAQGKQIKLNLIYVVPMQKYQCLQQRIPLLVHFCTANSVSDAMK